MIITPANLTLEQLLNENNLLRESNNLLGEANKKHTENYEILQGKYLLIEQELAKLKRMIFGSKSERFVPAINPAQMALDLNIEALATLEQKQQEITYTRTKTVVKPNNHHGRLPLPKHLERVEHLLNPQENIEGLKYIGQEITEELEYQPGKFYVNKYIRPKYAKPEGEGIIMAQLPERPIEKGIPGPGLLAQILIDKYVDHLPLYRQLQRFKRDDIHIPPSTINDWVKFSCRLLSPLADLLKAELFSSNYLMVDESPIKVLDRDKPGVTHQGYYWVYYSPEKGLVLFDYRPGRGRDGPTEMLKNFKGHLQTDGYTVYDTFNKLYEILLVGCMAHARRYFEEALDNNKQLAEYMLEQIQLLYKVERLARENNYTHDQRLELRQTESVPVLATIKEWLLDNAAKVQPKTPIGKAINYSLTRWDKLCVYAGNGKLEIDNNPVENLIRPLALGRKNYLFAGSHEAAQRAAIIYSFLLTCKIRNVNPQEWLKETLSKIPEQKSLSLHLLFPQ
jgi:transposase